jgi:hypothetical protein
LDGLAGENDFHDGTAMAATSTHVFVASRNLARKIGTDLGFSVDVWRKAYPQYGFVQLPRPQMPVDTNPILVANSNKLFVIAARNRVLSIAAYDDFAETWSDPVTIASGLADASPTLTNCAIIRHSGSFTAAILPALLFGLERIVVWYPVTRVRGSVRNAPRLGSAAPSHAQPECARPSKFGVPS